MEWNGVQSLHNVIRFPYHRLEFNNRMEESFHHIVWKSSGSELNDNNYKFVVPILPLSYTLNLGIKDKISYMLFHPFPPLPNLGGKKNGKMNGYGMESPIPFHSILSYF